MWNSIEDVLKLVLFTATLLIVAIVAFGLWPIVLGKVRDIRRERFLRGRQPQSDESFLAELLVTQDDAAIVLEIRKLMAKYCSVSPHMIHAGDVPEVLCRMMQGSRLSTNGYRQRAFLLDLEDDLKLPLRLPPTQFPRFRQLQCEDPATFGDWSLKVVQWLKENRRLVK